MEPQVSVRHHPQVALTHRGKDRRNGDGIWGEVLKLNTVVVAERPHEAAWQGSEAVAVELGEGDDVLFGGFGSWWSTSGAIHSGRVEEARGHRSPSFSRSLSRRSVMDDGRQSSAATSLTGISSEGGG